MSNFSKVITFRTGKPLQGNGRLKMFSNVLRYHVSHRSDCKPRQHCVTSDVKSISKTIQF